MKNPDVGVTVRRGTPPPATGYYRGYRGDPIPFEAQGNEFLMARTQAQAMARWLRSLTWWGRLLNRLAGVRCEMRAPTKQPLRLVEKPKDN